MADLIGAVGNTGELTGIISSAVSLGGAITGQRGLKGDKGDKGDTGATGTSISSVVLNQDYTLTINFSDGTSTTTTSVRGPQGAQGETGQTGATGNGIASVEKTGTSGLVDTYTITFTSGATTTFTVTNGADGQDGQDGQDGSDGQDGADGTDGVSPEVTVTSITGGHSVTITDADHPTGQSFNVMDGADGADGQDGSDGQDGVSPEVSVTSITGGHTVTITDADHPSGQSFNVMDGEDGQTGATGADGYSPSASVSKSGNTATITITDKNGTTTADVYDGVGAITDVTQNGTSVLDGSVAKVTVPTKVSDLQNDSGFLTTETDPTVPSWAKAASKPSYTASEVGALPDTTTIPTISQIVITLTTAGWSNNTQTVYVTGLTTSDAVVLSPAPTSIADYSDAGIYCSAQATGSLTFVCEYTPEDAISVNVLVIKTS